jgi:hypothetical protein
VVGTISASSRVKVRLIQSLFEFQTAWLSLASNWISSFPSSLFKSYGPIAGTIWSWGQLSWLGLVMTLYQLGAFGWVETLMIYGNGEDRFTRVSHCQHHHVEPGKLPSLKLVSISST